MITAGRPTLFCSMLGEVDDPKGDSNQSQPISQLQESSDTTDINNNDVSSTGNTMTYCRFTTSASKLGHILTSLHDTIREVTRKRMRDTIKW